MSQPADEFQVCEIPAEQRDKPCDGVAINYETSRARGRAEYSRGAELYGFAGPTIEEETAELDLISVSGELHQGVGSKLFARLIEQIREERFRYLRMSIISPYVVKMVERALSEGQIQARAYRTHQSGDLFDLTSDQLMADTAVVGAEEAIEKIDKTPKLECVIRL